MTRGRSLSADTANAFWKSSLSSYLKSHLEDYNLEASNKITNKSGKQVNGFWGIQALTAPIIL